MPEYNWRGWEYQLWKKIIRRCYSPTDRSFPHYGGRGIAVCPEWRASLELFARDIGPRPSPAHSLDRIDNDGNYEPGNVRWATTTEQNRNRRSCRVLRLGDESHTLSEWSQILGICPGAITARLRAGWGLALALTAPKREKKENPPAEPRPTPEFGVPRCEPRDLTGLECGRLKVEELAGTKGEEVYWWCRCACGNRVPVRGWHLTSPKKLVRSCGCLRREVATSRKTTHGRRHTPEYEIWKSMRQRCCNPNNKGYPQYGGRGIAVCDRWRESFEAFLEDVGLRPTPRHSLDRINVNGDYCPENCRWATRLEQGGNTRKCRYLTLNGRTETLSEWARITGLSVVTLHFRLKSGWAVEDALTLPSKGKGGAKKTPPTVLPFNNPGKPQVPKGCLF